MPDPLSLGLLGGGLLSGAIGSLFGGDAEDEKRKRLEAAAAMPGLDIGGITSGALDDILGQFPKSSGVARKVNTFNTDELNRLLEQAAPGYSRRQTAQGGVIADYLAGKVPQSLQDLLQNNAAVKSWTGGWADSMTGANLANTLLREGLNLQSLGLGANNAFTTATRSTAVPNLLSPSDLAINPAQYLGIRANERSAAQNILTGAASVPGQTAQWGGFLSGLGGLGSGIGLMSLLSRPRTGLNDAESGFSYNW